MELPRRYPANHYKVKASRYRRAVRLIFGAQLDQATEQRTAEIIDLGRRIDDYLDKDVLGLHQRSEDILEYLGAPMNVASEFPSLAIDSIGEEMYERFNQLAKKIIHINEKIKTTHSAEHYSRYRRLEGRLYARLITGVATSTTRSQTGYQTYMRLMEPIGEVTNIMNSLVDLPGEHDRGEVSISPSLGTRLTLLRGLALTAIHAPKRIRKNR